MCLLHSTIFGRWFCTEPNAHGSRDAHFLGQHRQQYIFSGATLSRYYVKMFLFGVDHESSFAFRFSVTLSWESLTEEEHHHMLNLVPQCTYMCCPLHKLDFWLVDAYWGKSISSWSNMKLASLGAKVASLAIVLASIIRIKQAQSCKYSWISFSSAKILLNNILCW